MQEKLKIAFIASEVVPFAKTGGLADVAGALPKALKKLGHEIIVIMPRYYKIDKTQLTKLPEPLGVPMGSMGELWAAVYTTMLPNSTVRIYFIDYEQYFGRSGLYEENNISFADNGERFVFFTKAAMQLCKMLSFVPDIFHANDWHSASVAILAKTRFVHDFAHAKTVLTIHNMQHQGIFHKGLMNLLEIGWEHFNSCEFESMGGLNMLKGGIMHADAVTTVSSGYAAEIQTPDFGFGLDGHLRAHSQKIYGILNGVDYDEWNPSKDKYIAKNFDVDAMKGKNVCKRALQKHFGLKQKYGVPVIGFVGRFAEQKGIGLIASVISGLLDMDVQIVMLGAGEKWAEGFFSHEAYHRENFGLHVGYSEELAHQIEAGCDLFLMPSLFEPCGLNQIYSLRYGTLPIVRATGGLDDTIENYDAKNNSGNGFKFYEASSDALYHTVKWALDLYFGDKEAFEQLRTRAMRAHFSWEDAAKNYVEVYRGI
ncbi:MAG: glycogen synthase [Sulfurospirillum sp.]|nr:glycogen synthase [Sulfurospirillum sp.]